MQNDTPPSAPTATGQDADLPPLHRPLHEWRRQLRREQWERASWRTKLWWMRQWLRRVPTVVRDARRAVQQHGRHVADAHGVSQSRQFVQQCYFALRYDTSPLSYYTYRVYRPERWARADTLPYDSWTSHGRMIRVLNLRTGASPNERAALDDKRQFSARCAQHNLPTPSVLASFDDGTACGPCASPADLPPADLFAKPRDGKQGRGAAKYVYAGQGCWTNADTTYDAAGLMNRLKRRSEGEPLLLQRALRNASSWRPFTSGSLATVRLMTGRLPGGSILPFGAKLRMPTGNAIVDNTSAGGIASQINLQSGLLGPAVSVKPVNGRFTHELHPDTEHPLPGAALPHWSNVVDLGCRAHDAFDIVTIAWDIALTPDGLTLLEGNCSWSAHPLLVPEIRLRRYARVYDAWMRTCPPTRCSANR